MAEGPVEEFRKLFPGISADAAKEGFDRLLKVISDTPVNTPTSHRKKIFRDAIYESAVSGETWAIEIGESEGWLVVVDSDFGIEASSG